MSVTYYFETANGSLTGSATTTTSGNTLNSNELLAVTSGSTVSAVILQISAVDVTGSGTAVSNPGNGQWVYNGGSLVANGIPETLSGGAMVVASGGVANATTIDAGGGIVVLGGSTSGTIINSGGFEAVFSGGITSATSMAGGYQDVWAGGVANGTLVYQGGAQVVHSGGAVNGSEVGTFGTQDVQSGATADTVTIIGGGIQTVRAGAISLNSDNSGGVANIYGTDATATVTLNGTENVLSGGYAVSTVVNSGGQQIVSAGGVAQGATIEALGTQTVVSGGSAIGTGGAGGNIIITSGGGATALVMSTGELIVKAGGVATGAIGNGGLFEVMSGGIVSGTALNGGQLLLQGGTATNSWALGGGSIIVASGGIANGTTIYATASETVYSGGTASAIQLSGAAVLSLQAGATVVGDIVMTGGGGTVQMVGTTLPKVKIDGFTVGDHIDLSSITGGTGATYANGTLSITGTSTSISLGNAPDGLLVVSHDSGGGTIVSIQAETVAQAIAGASANPVAIVDSAANVQANIAALASAKVESITLTDSSLVTLSMTAAQSGLLSKISGNYAAAVDASAPNATVAGAAGHGVTVNFLGAASQYSITPAGDGVNFTVTSNNSVDHFSNVELLHFSNATEVVASATPVAGATLSGVNIAELYAAGLGRAPDAAGLAYYEAQVTATPSLTGAQVASWFLSSSEYTGSHNYAQTAAGDAQFVSDLYTNMLHRTGSSAELAYYQTIINQVTTGQTAGTAAYTAAELAAHAVVLSDFSVSAEFLANIQITAQNPASAQHWLVLI